MKAKRKAARDVLARWIAALLTLIVVGSIACVLWYRWDSRVNHGFTFGYYGEFNRVGNALASLPGITVASSGYNPDIALEEFTFIVMTEDGQEIQLWFLERDPIRRLSGAKLSTALRGRIAQESPNQSMRHCPAPATGGRGCAER